MRQPDGQMGFRGRKQLLNAARDRVADEVQMYLPGIM